MAITRALRSTPIPARTSRNPSFEADRVAPVSAVSVDGGGIRGVPVAPSTPPLGVDDSVGVAGWVGISVGMTEAGGCSVGCPGGVGGGCSGGVDVGCAVGCSVGCSVGVDVGCSVGVDVGCSVGCSVGVDVGCSVGCSVGVDVGVDVA